jgi:hypothetical protein
VFEKQNEVTIRAENLERSNLTVSDRLELHCLDYAVVLIPGEMTAMELISASEALQKLAAELLNVLLEACSACDNCGQEEPCELMCENAMSEETDSKGEKPFSASSTGEFTDITDPLDFENQPTDFDDGYAVSDISPDMLKLLQKSGVCMRNLQEKLSNDLLVYFNGKVINEYDSEKI